jgi:hypothetical protein
MFPQRLQHQHKDALIDLQPQRLGPSRSPC